MNFSPSLSPIINNIVVEIVTASKLDIKAILLPNNTIPKIVIAAFNKGMKQKVINEIAKINVYIKIAYLPLLFMKDLRLPILVMLQAFRIRYSTIDIKANVNITKKILSHLFIVYAMMDEMNLLKNSMSTAFY